MENLKINWDHTWKNSTAQKARIKSFKQEPKKDGFNVWVCTNCNSVWEKMKTFDHASDINKKIPDFPRWGLKRKVCKECLDA